MAVGKFARTIQTFNILSKAVFTLLKCCPKNAQESHNIITFISDLGQRNTNSIFSICVVLPEEAKISKTTNTILCIFATKLHQCEGDSG
jgi:hypothetical protein